MAAALGAGAVRPFATAAASAAGSSTVGRIEFFYDIVSPYSYLAFETLASLRRTWPVTVVLRPFFLGGVMHATSNQPPASNPYKGKYMVLDLERQAAYKNVPFAFASKFPINTIATMRLLVALDNYYGGSGGSPQLWDASHALFEAYWYRGHDVADVAVQKAALVPAVLDEALFERLAHLDAKSDAVKAQLKAASDEAVARGAFGAPTLFVTRTGETAASMYFGSDRFHIIARQLGLPCATL